MAEEMSASPGNDPARFDAGDDCIRRSSRDLRFESSSNDVDAGAGGSPAASKPGGPEPTFAEHPGFGIWPCDNPWHTTHKPHPEPVGKCPDCPNEWWASDGTECPEEYALLAEIRWLRERVAAAVSRGRRLEDASPTGRAEA